MILNKKINIVLIGTPKFAYYQFNNIIKNKNFNIICIITKNNNIKKIIKNHKIKIFNVKNSQDINKIFHKILKFSKIDIILIIAFGIILSKKFFKIAKLGCYNIHPSLLPKWRGPSPIQYTLLNNDLISGITIIKINKYIDKGKIVFQKICKINKKETYNSLYKKLTLLSNKIIINILYKIYNKKIILYKQNEKLATYSKKINKKDGKINWRLSAKKIESQIRAYYNWPKTFFYYKNNNIFIWKAKIYKKKYKYNIGQIITYNRKYLKIQTGNYILKIIIIQINNRRKMKIHEFFNSKPLFFKEGDILL